MHIKNFGSKREMLTLNMDVSKLDPISEKLLKKCYRWYRSHRPNDFILRWLILESKHKDGRDLTRVVVRVFFSL